LNRLVSRTVIQNGQQISKENFIHDGDQIVLEFSNNQLAQRNLWGVAVDELLATDYLLDDDTLWALANHQNSITNVLQNNNGQVINIAEIDYDAFGNIVEGHNPLHYAYTGKYHDNITNLQWNINRWYDSTTGQWISEDPISFGGGDANLYRYVGNAVLDFVDADGLKKTTEVVEISVKSKNDKAVMEMLENAEESIKNSLMADTDEARKWLEDYKKDPGAYGKDVHNAVSGSLSNEQKKQGWVANVYVDKNTHKVIAIGGNNPRGIDPNTYNQVDLIKLKSGCKFGVGTILTSDMIEDLYEIKTGVSNNGGLSSNQKKALLEILNFGENDPQKSRGVKIPTSKFSWNSVKTNFVDAVGKTRLLSLKKVFVGLGAVSAYDALQSVARANNDVYDRVIELHAKRAEIENMNLSDNEKNAMLFSDVMKIIAEYDTNPYTMIMLQAKYNKIFGKK
jgi:RHS repeat-associated protein